MQEMYLVRDRQGRMVTIIAFSLGGAKREYLRKHKPPRQTQFSIKLRNSGDWTHYNVL